MKLKRHKDNPILSPKTENEWENLSVCNPGAYYENGIFYLLYRAAGNDEQHVIHFGLATSKDGVHFERVSARPVLSPSIDGMDAGCVEDPRIVKYGDYFYITYAYRPFHPGRYWLNPNSMAYMPGGPKEAPRFIRENLTNSGLLMSKDLKTFHRLGRITKGDSDNRDVVLFPEKIAGKYLMLHRPKELTGAKYSCAYPSIWISFSDDLLTWEDGHVFVSGNSYWETKVGGASPPLRTDKGWLVLYHAVDGKGVYRVGALLLDIDNPLRIIARTKDFIMEPEQEYETNGLYPGCVFPTGNVIRGDELFVYYGAGDRHCGLATCSVTELIDYLLEEKNAV